MIQAKDLRCGNLVLDHNDRVCIVERIDQLLNTVKLTALDNGYIYSPAQIEEIKPIPLTEDWLVKFRFHPHSKIDFRTFYNIGTFLVEIIPDWVAVYYTDREVLICYIKYVHQIQNLYYFLTNEELTLNK